ncbi:MAG: response regulator, partial [bacterium]|nr:response regulator [bacterium]
MRMPELDGLQLAQEIRQYRGAKALPLVMLTSLGQYIEDEHRHLFTAFLHKPIKPSQLYNILLELFAGKPDSHARRLAETVEEKTFDTQMGTRLPLRVLVADDHPTNQKLVLLLLKRLGYHADMAANGLEVLEALRRRAYDVILMDVQMPEMDGLEATHTICQTWPAEQRPRIIAVTANALKEDRNVCLAAGMDDYLAKPIQIQELVAALNKCPSTRQKTEGRRPEENTKHQTPNTKHQAVLDPQAMENLRHSFGDDFSSVLPELIASFLESAPALLSELRQAGRQGDPDTMGRKAHTLKSSSALLGAATFSALCREVENIVNAGRVEGITEQIAQIDAEYEKVKAALETCMPDRQ